MKRRELIQKIEAMGCVLIRRAGKHDWYQNPLTRMAQPLPRHSEINEFLAESLDPAEDGYVHQLWAAEACRRRDEVRSGRVQTIPGDEALTRVRRTVAR